MAWIFLNGQVPLIRMCNAPLSIIEDPMYHDFSKYNKKVIMKTLKNLIFYLTQLVQARTSE